MIATLTRRVARLEVGQPPPDPPAFLAWPDDDPPPPWWAAAPVALRTYLLTVAGDADRDVDDVDAEVGELCRHLHEAARAGTRLPLATAQYLVLWHRWCKVFHTTPGAAIGRFWGVSDGALFDAYTNRPGGLVALWRRSGSRALDAPTLRLLTADDTP